jgi:hypothetical protein
MVPESPRTSHNHAAQSVTTLIVAAMKTACDALNVAVEKKKPQHMHARAFVLQ